MKMKFSVFLFLLCFMIMTSQEPIYIGLVEDMHTIKEIQYQSTLNHNEAYIVLFSNPDCMLYLLGAQTKSIRKVEAAVQMANQVRDFYDIPGANNIRIARKITNLKINNSFKGQLQLFNVHKKIPRLYRLGGPDIISQIPLDSNLINNMDSFVLHNGSDLTVYHSPSTNKKKRKKAKLFATYIADFEKKEAINIHTSELDGKKDFSTASETFCGKINEIVQSLLQSKMDSLSTNNVENPGYDQDFESLRNYMFRYLQQTIFHDSTIFYKYNTIFRSIFSSRAASTSTTLTSLNSVFEAATATGHLFKVITSTDSVSRGSSSRGSSSRGSSRRSSRRSSRTSSSTDFAQHRAVEENTMPRQTTNVATTSIPATSFTDRKIEKVLPIIFGQPDCLPPLIPIPLDFLKSECIYLLLDFEINEFFIYLGRNATRNQYILTFMLIEIFLDNRPDVEVTFIADGNPLPPPFVIHVKSELKNLQI